MKTAEEALDWVRRHRIALEAAKVEGVPSLAHEIVGGPFKGSWWGHPKGQLIFKLASAVHDSGEVVVLKLIEGKNTYVHRALWPELLRVVTDPSWRKERVEALPPGAKRLCAEVERQGEVNDANPKALKALEASLLVHADSHHTREGHHEKTLTSWARWAAAAGARASEQGLQEVLDTLSAAAHGVKVLTRPA